MYSAESSCLRKTGHVTNYCKYNYVYSTVTAGAAQVVLGSCVLIYFNLPKGLIHDSRHVGFQLSCKLAMCYAGGQTLEKRQIAENPLVEILK